MTPRILIRVDASLAIGSGHAMRCLSLASALRSRGADVHFASRVLPGHLHATIAAQGFTVHALPESAETFVPRADLAHAAWLGTSEARDLADTRAVLQRLGGVAALVVDHYALDARWQAALRAETSQIVVIDDLADREHDADILVDQNLAPDPERRYVGRVGAGCLQLLGPGYALLREEFAQARAALPSRRGRLERVLVFLGGVDAGAYTERVVEALARLPQPPQVDVVLGSANPRAAAIAARCAELGFSCAQAVSDMARRMVEADFAIGAGGSTSWERACLGLPGLLLIVADNQRSGARALAAQACAIAMDDAEATPGAIAAVVARLAAAPQELEAMAARNLSLVDGRGAQRVARAVLPPAITLRRAQAGDGDALFGWRNHEHVRRHSHSSAAIERADHERWFAATLCNPQRDLLIAEHDGRAVGVLRYDSTAAEALVSIYLVPGAAGGGFGPAILRAGSGWLAAMRPDVARIRAEVLEDNAASHKAFREAGYTLSGKDYFRELGT